MAKLITNGIIKNIVPDETIATSILIDGETIVAIGDPVKMDLKSADDLEVIDAKGAVILPGFIDAHNHFTLMGIQSAALDLGGLFQKEDILRKIAAHHQTLDRAKPLRAYNYEIDYLVNGNRVQAGDLEAAAPNRLIQITDRSGHMSVTTSGSLLKAGIQLSPNDCFFCGETQRCGMLPFTGEICGVANSTLYNYVQMGFRDGQILKFAWKQAGEIAVSHGVTCIHAMMVEEEVEELLAYDECLPVNLKIYAETKNVKLVKSAGLKQIGGCGRVMVDGDTGPYTAAFLEPYANRPDSKGLLYYSDEELDDYVWEAHSAGLQVALHCVGDAASNQFFNAVEHAQERLPRNLRHRIEHFEFPNPEQMARAKKLGVAVSIQPAFNHYWPNETYVEQMGEYRAFHADPVRSFLSAGLAVGFGSDCTVTPCDPLWTIACAAHHSVPRERISVKEGLARHTIGGAYLGKEESQRGSIAVGKIADLVFLAADPEQVNPDEVQDIPILRTMVCGETVYLA